MITIQPNVAKCEISETAVLNLLVSVGLFLVVCQHRLKGRLVQKIRLRPTDMRKVS